MGAVYRAAVKTLCVYCHAEIDSDDTGVYQLVHGWERKRAQGGTNAIRLPHRDFKWACHACIEARVSGLENQAALW